LEETAIKLFLVAQRFGVKQLMEKCIERLLIAKPSKPVIEIQEKWSERIRSLLRKHSFARNL
jgi:hypothetical protein